MTETAATPIRILVAEDNVIARVGTVTLLGTQPDFEVIGEAEDGVAAFEQYRHHRPDVVITDLKMPRLDGVQLTQALTAESPPGRVLVLTYYDGDENVLRALKAGALGYVTKDVRRTALFEAVRTVAGGKRYIPVEIAARLADRAVAPALTSRELQVLEHIFRGQSNREIAGELAIAEKTVVMYVSQILAKLGVKSRTQAVSVALQRGILGQREP